MNLDSALSIGTGLTLTLISFGMLRAGCPRSSSCDRDNKSIGNASL
jgi:hypothetical protein